MGFAFLDILPENRRGLLARELLRDRLAPLVLRPRAKQGVSLPELGLHTHQLLLPIGPGDWKVLKPETRLKLWTATQKTAKKIGGAVLAVNRGLRPLPSQNPELFPIPVSRGDLFVLALALIVVEEGLNRYGREKLWLVGDFPGLFGLISLIGRIGAPVAIQSFYPSRFETIAYRILYEQGMALSVSYFNPSNWGPEDMVLLFDPVYLPFAAGAGKARNVFIIDLTDDSRSHAPRLESWLGAQGVDPSLKTLAPLLEAWFWGRTLNPDQTDVLPHEPLLPVRPASTSPDTCSRSAGQECFARIHETAGYISRIRQEGQELNLWGFFLDKDFRALYNTTQGTGTTI
ncbi:MAG: hypothetical protein HPY90_06820 [Syntrophothermus sp.]|uniref:hypothetical protein n=1 Tax=Syntrophothermus sp. TaxID=2736299 RepID=UPI00257E7C9D|nr:hypothetical protein [Syntrophothermus sp.]NSW82978.1 hypothetical protein [Syntrophothermus sp.]